MKHYSDRSGNSGIRGFETGPGFIVVLFADGKMYRYTDESAGQWAVGKMQALAEAGKGLCTFINRFVKTHYERRLS